MVFAHIAAPIPDTMAATSAAVLPLGIGTAACGLYQSDQLGLRPPSANPTQRGETLLVWGASSSVGCNAVQLATASGYQVIATASPRNEAMVLGLGAMQVINHGNPDVVAQVISALRGKTLVGAFHATGDLANTFDVMRQVNGRRFVTMTLPLQTAPPETVEAAACETTRWGR